MPTFQINPRHVSAAGRRLREAGIENIEFDGLAFLTVDGDPAEIEPILAAIKPADVMDRARQAAFRRVDTIHAALLADITGHKPAEERDTWAPKEAAARAYLDGTASETDTAMIDAEAAGDGVSGTDLAGIVVAKANEFRAAVGAAGAIRRAAKAAIAAIPDDAPDPEAAVEAALTEMQAAADTLRAQQG